MSKLSGASLSVGQALHFAEFPQFPGLGLVRQFPPFSDKFDGLTNFSPPQAWLILVTLHEIPVVYWPLIGQAISVHLQTNRWSDWIKCSCTTHYAPPLAWLTFGHAPLNWCSYLSFDWLSSFCTFADKPLIGFNSNLVGQFIMGFPQPDKLLVMLHWIPALIPLWILT